MAGSLDRWIEIRIADFYAPELHEDGGESVVPWPFTTFARRCTSSFMIDWRLV
ncbi:hypothetical protein [Hephaestia caeni]|uniref:hypothetical protein n=1 Tax=Hephaestia caeni TaxID=645617 RepID=UPI001474EE95|nr:hypothetical protein [Hephaestia caeni]